jgi:hypothetical protein
MKTLSHISMNQKIKKDKLNRLKEIMWPETTVLLWKQQL